MHVIMPTRDALSFNVVFRHTIPLCRPLDNLEINSVFLGIYFASYSRAVEVFFHNGCDQRIDCLGLQLVSKPQQHLSFKFSTRQTAAGLRAENKASVAEVWLNADIVLQL